MGSSEAARRVLAVCCAMSTAWTSYAAEGSSQIAGGVLEWETVGEDVVKMRFEYPGELTYVAVGLSEGTMPTTSAVLAQVNADIREVDISGKSGGSVVTSSSPSTLANANLEVSGGTTVLSFEAASIGSRSFNLEGSDKVAVAWGDEGSFSRHQRRAVADVTWTENVADETEPPTEDGEQVPSAEPTALDPEQTSSPTTSPTQTASPTPQPAEGPIAIVNSVDLLDGELNYKLEDDSITFDFDYPVVTGWISIAIGSSEQMVGGTAVVVSSLSSQEPEVEVYDLGGKVSSQVTKIVGAEIDVKVSKNRGSTKLAFTTSKFGDQSLALDGSDFVMVARGSSEFFGIHDEFQGKSVTWRSGEADSFDTTPVLKAHAFFMVFGFLFIMPLATLPSVFRERYNLLGGEPQEWFTLHRKMQVISCLMVLLGFILAASTQSVHFDTPHKSLGGVIMLFVVIQPLLAVFFRKGCTRPFWQASHFIFAGVIFFGAVVTSLLGLGTFIASDFFRFLVFCGSTITIGCSIAVFINRMYKLCCDNGDATPNPEKN